MIYKPKYFSLDELVCPHVFYRFGEWSWQFFSLAFLETLDWVRERTGPTFVNNWDQYLNSDYIKYIKERATNGLPIIQKDLPESPKGLLDERGVRCDLCSLYLEKSAKGIIYISPHFRWQAADFDVQGKISEEVRQWLIANQYKIPHPIRLEKNVSWVHLDAPGNAELKIQLVNP